MEPRAGGGGAAAVACGAGGGRGGGLDSFGTLRVALGGVFEGEAACASAIEI